MQQRMVAITHASGLLAEALLEKLPESGISPDSLVLLDSESHVGSRLSYADSYLKIQDQHEFDYSDCALVLMLQYDQLIEQKVSNLDAVLLSHTLQVGDKPIYAADANAKLDISYSQQSIKIANAELSCLLGVLPTLHQKFSITRINTVLMRSAELRGKAGIDELAAQTVALLNSREAEPQVYPLQIAFNIIPEASDSTLNQDLASLIGNTGIECVHQFVDVPIFHGFMAAVQVTFDSDVDLQGCGALLGRINNVQLKSAAGSPISDCNQSFGCVINRLEQGPDKAKTLQFWMIADPIRYGLANNYVNVTEILLKSFL
jgi:aspartate-semialdehyde dehydrogenase